MVPLPLTLYRLSKEYERKTINFSFFSGGGSNETLKKSYGDGHHNSVALAAVRDLQTQQSLRMGAPLPTKSVLLIRAVQSIETSNLMTPELVTPTYCDEEKTPEVEEKKISANEEKSSRLPTVSEAAKAVAIIGTDKKIGFFLLWVYFYFIWFSGPLLRYLKFHANLLYKKSSFSYVHIST